MSDTQTLEGIKAASPVGATHYHIGLQLYLKKGSFGYCGRWFRNELGHPGWPITGKSDEWVEAGVASGEIIVLADTSAHPQPVTGVDPAEPGGDWTPDDMAESMPFELLDGDEEKPRSKYHREIAPGVWVDCYDVLKAFDVRCPALQHMIKKCLAPGQRGHKDLEQDMNDIVASAERARELAKC